VEHTNLSIPLIHQRPYIGKKFIITAGGYDGAARLNSTEIYDIENNVWCEGPPFPVERAGTVAVTIDNEVYFIGGYCNTGELDNFVKYDPYTMKYSNSVTNMKETRFSPSATVYNDKIFVIGGEQEAVTNLATLEMYDPITATWIELSSMRNKRRNLASVTYRDNIYAIGGWNDSHGTHSSVEIYDPVTDKWKILSNMTMAHSSPSCAVWNNGLYVFSGWCGGAAAPVEMIDFRENKWRVLPPMDRMRSSASAIALEYEILIIAGRHYVDEVRYNSVESFDPRSNTWRYLSPNITPRSGHGSAVVLL